MKGALCPGARAWALNLAQGQAPHLSEGRIGLAGWGQGWRRTSDRRRQNGWPGLQSRGWQLAGRPPSRGVRSQGSETQPAGQSRSLGVGPGNRKGAQQRKRPQILQLIQCRSEATQAGKTLSCSIGLCAAFPTTQEQLCRASQQHTLQKPPSPPLAELVGQLGDRSKAGNSVAPVPDAVPRCPQRSAPWWPRRSGQGQGPRTRLCPTRTHVERRGPRR